MPREGHTGILTTFPARRAIILRTFPPRGGIAFPRGGNVFSKNIIKGVTILRTHPPEAAIVFKEHFPPTRGELLYSREISPKGGIILRTFPPRGGINLRTCPPRSDYFKKISFKREIIYIMNISFKGGNYSKNISFKRGNIFRTFPRGGNYLQNISPKKFSPRGNYFKNISLKEGELF